MGAFMVLIGSHSEIDRLAAISPPGSAGLDGVIIAPYVPDAPAPFIEQGQCKISNRDKPIIEQLNECKKQRIGWLKI